MKNSTKGPLIIVTLGTLAIITGFVVFGKKKDGSKPGGWKLPDVNEDPTQVDDPTAE